MPTYEMNYGEIRKQKGQMDEQMSALGAALSEMKNVEESFLQAGQYSAADREEIMSRFEAYIGSGEQIRQTGTSNAETLQQISDRYQAAEQG